MSERTVLPYAAGPATMTVLQAAITHGLWPLLVVAGVTAVELGLQLGYEPAAVLLAVNGGTLGVVLVAEQLTPHRPEWSALGDRQTVNDLGHGILQSAVGERIGGLVLLAAGGCGQREAGRDGDGPEADGPRRRRPLPPPRRGRRSRSRRPR